MNTLKLGHFDSNKNPPSWKAYIQTYHEHGMRSDAFRAEANNKWVKPSKVEGKAVTQLQQKLSKLGYLNDSQVDGIFGYRTFSAVRLYQEYTRTVTGNASVGKPDGIVGPKTHKSITDSVRNKELCEWFKPIMMAILSIAGRLHRILIAILDQTHAVHTMCSLTWRRQLRRISQRKQKFVTP